MLLGFASLVLGVAAASVSRTIAAAAAAGRAAGRAFAAGFGAVRTGMSRVYASILRGLATLRVAWSRGIASIIAGGGIFAVARAMAVRLGAAMRSGLSRGWARMTAPFSAALSRMSGAWTRWVSSVIRRGGLFRIGRTAGASLLRGMGNAFASGTSAVASMIGPLGAILAAGIVVLAPVMGAALGAAITAAVAIGVVAAGIAIAAKQSDRVQRAFADTFKPIGAQLAEQATVAFEGPLLKSAAIFKDAWKDVGPVMGQAFQKASQFVEPLAQGIAQLVKNMIGGGGFLKLMDAAGPVMSILSTGLARLGSAFDNMFRSIASAGPGLAKGMVVIFALLSAAIVALGNTIEFLSKAFDKGTEVAQRYAEVYAKMLGWLPGVGNLWKSAAESLGLFNDMGGKTRDIMPIAGAAAQNSAQGFYSTAAAAEKARKALSDLSEKIYGLISAQLGADQALAAFRRALMGVADAVKENGTSTQQYTKAGEANIQMVQEMVGLALQARDAAIKLAGGEKASAQAVYAANAAFNAQIAQLEATLRAAGFTKAQIDALLGKYRELANAPNINKTITTTVKTIFVEVGQPMRIKAGGNQIAYASGTNYARAGVALVGEEGPELVRLKGGERIWPADETAKILAGSQSLAAASSQELGEVGRASALATMERPAQAQVGVKVYIGNEEFRGYVAEVTDERADARAATSARKLRGK